LLDYNYIVVPLPTGFYVSAYLNGEGVLLFLTPVMVLNYNLPPHLTMNNAFMWFALIILERR